MTREQAINYLFSCGFTHEQVGEVVRALTYEPASLSVDEVTALAEWTARLTKASEDAYNKGYADGMKAQAEPKTKIEESNFSHEQYVLDTDTAWKCGYEAGMKAQEPRKGHWDIKDKMWWVCSACGCQTRMMKKYNVPNFCPACGADMREVEE